MIQSACKTGRFQEPGPSSSHLERNHVNGGKMRLIRNKHAKAAGAIRQASFALAFGLSLAAAPATTSPAQEVNFAGKTVRMILGQAAGGGADTSARLIAAFLGKHLPGAPTILVVNMPGANGIVAGNHFVHQVAADGTTFFAGSGSQIISAAEKNSAVKYNPAKFEFIGSVQNPGTVLIAAKSA